MCRSGSCPQCGWVSAASIQKGCECHRRLPERTLTVTTAASSVRRMTGECSHGHGGHPRGVSVHTDLRWLAVALAINAGLMVVEVTVGVIANSLALLTD